jgi:spore coat protein JC
MWIYQKSLEYPVKIKNPDPALAKFIITALGGPDGELAASTRYLSQRFGMPYREVTGILTDVGTEELSHVEIVSSILYQLTRNLSDRQIKESGFDTYFVDHTAGIYPQGASGAPFTAAVLQSKGDIFTDLNEDLAAEMKARTMYDNILRMVDDPDVREPFKFLREREVVHYQRFAEALGIAQERAECKSNFYLTNPNFDKNCTPPCTNVCSTGCAAKVRTSEIQIPSEEKRHHPSVYAFEVKRPY